MKKNPLNLLVIAVLAMFVAFTACQDYDDDIGRLDKEIAAAKTEAQAKIDAAKTELNNAINAAKAEVQNAINSAITEVNGKITKLQADLAKAATKEELDAVKADLANNYLKKTVFQEFQQSATQAMELLTARVVTLETNSATKAELEAAKTALEALIADLQADLDDLREAAATKVELQEAVANLEALIAKTKADLLEVTDALDERVGSLEDRADAVEDRVDSLEVKSATKVELALVKAELEATIAVVDSTLTDLIGKHNDLKGAFDLLKEAFEDLEDSYNTFIGDYEGTVADILEQITTEVTALENKLTPRIMTLEALLQVTEEGESETLNDIYAKIQENTDSIDALRLDMLAKYYELKAEDMRLDSLIQVNAANIAINAGNIETNRLAIKAIQDYINNNLEPRLAVIEGDIDALEVRMDAAETAIGLNIVNINILSQQVKGLTFIPTRGLPGEKTIKLYWNAGDYTADHVLMYRVSPASAKVGKDFVVESLNYQITTRATLSDNANIVDVYLNGDAYMHTSFPDVLCVPVHIVGEGCEVFEPGAQEALSLVLTVKNIGLKADAEEDDDFNVYVRSTEMVNTEFIHTPIVLAELGKGTLNERLLEVTQPAAEFFANHPEEFPVGTRNWNVMLYKLGIIDLYDYVLSYYNVEDDYRFYNNLGSFGRPYTDKPVYDAPIYTFEIVSEWEGAAPHFIDPQDRYTEIVDGSFLRVKEGKVNSADDKKVIIKVTQVNAADPDCQPVGYLVVKITNDPGQAWADVRHTYDFTNIAYYHTDAAGIINDPANYIFGKNPGDVDVVLDKFPLASIKKEEFWNSTYVTAWPAVLDYIEAETSFEPFDYNHIGITKNLAMEQIEIDPDYATNSFLVKVSPQAPAGKYVVTYKVRYTKGTPAVQAGPDLYLTFKFNVGVRKMTVQKDGPVWTGPNTLKVQFARINNTLGYTFLSETGYRGNLTQAFIHDAGTKVITVATDNAKDHGDAAINPAWNKPVPVYAPMFEFIPQQALLDAGFSYEEGVGGYLTQLMLAGERAANIYKDPADNMVRIYIEYNAAGDALYNWINGINPGKLFNTFNEVWAPENLIKVRMVTDVNASTIELNKFYLTEFDVLFERALHTKFTTVALDDKQDIQKADFNFLTNTQTIIRGLFDGDAKLVSSSEATYDGTAAGDLGKWYGVQTLATMPVDPDRAGHVDYDYVEYSADGVNWQPIPLDLRADTHPSRYFDLIPYGTGLNFKWQAVFQGDEKVSTAPIYFRVPIVNENGLSRTAVAFRFGKANVMGYAIFKINPRG